MRQGVCGRGAAAFYFSVFKKKVRDYTKGSVGGPLLTATGHLDSEVDRVPVMSYSHLHLME